MSCGAAGNVIQFVAKLDDISEREAALLDAVPGIERASELGSRETAEEKSGSGSSVTLVDPQTESPTRAQLCGMNIYTFTAKRSTRGISHLAKADLQAVHRKTAPSERRKVKEASKFKMTNWRPRKRKKPRKN